MRRVLAQAPFDNPIAVAQPLNTLLAAGANVCKPQAYGPRRARRICSPDYMPLSAARYPRIRCEWLPDLEPSTDRANRGKPLGRKLIGEHLNSLLLQRIFLRIADPARPSADT